MQYGEFIAQNRSVQHYKSCLVVIGSGVQKNINLVSVVSWLSLGHQLVGATTYPRIDLFAHNEKAVNRIWNTAFCNIYKEYDLYPP